MASRAVVASVCTLGMMMCCAPWAMEARSRAAAPTPVVVTRATEIEGAGQAPWEVATAATPSEAEGEARTSLPPSVSHAPAVVDEEIMMRVLEALSCDELKALLRTRTQGALGLGGDLKRRLAACILAKKRL